MKDYIDERWLLRKERLEGRRLMHYGPAYVEWANERWKRERERETARELVDLLLRETNLTKVQRKVVDLFLEGIGLREIARKRGVTLRAVQKALGKAVARLRETAEKMGIAPEDYGVDYEEEYSFDWEDREQWEE